MKKVLAATHCGKMFTLLRMVGAMEGKCESLNDVTYNTPFKNCDYMFVDASVLYDWLSAQTDISRIFKSCPEATICFVRHGQSHYNVLTEEEVATLMEGVANGDPNSKELLINPRLTTVGEEQASKSILKAIKWDVVATSPYVRAQRTAELICGYATNNIVEGLKEVDLSNKATTFEDIKFDCIIAITELLLLCE